MLREIDTSTGQGEGRVEPPGPGAGQAVLPAEDAEPQQGEPSEIAVVRCWCCGLQN